MRTGSQSSDVHASCVRRVKHIECPIICFVPAKSGETVGVPVLEAKSISRRSPRASPPGSRAACAERKIDYSVWRMRVGIPKKAGP